MRRAGAWPRRLWPRRLAGQITLTLALALLLAQTINTVLLYRIANQHQREAIIHSAAFKLLAASHRDRAGQSHRCPPFIKLPPNLPPALSTPPTDAGNTMTHVHILQDFSPAPGDIRWRDAEAQLHHILLDQGLAISALVAVERPISADPIADGQLTRRRSIEEGLGRTEHHPFFAMAPHRFPDRLLLVAMRPAPGPDGRAPPWLVVRALLPAQEVRWHLFGVLLIQTLLIYVLLIGAMHLILRHITRPLAALTERVTNFTERRKFDGILSPDGPEDIRRLIRAHNAMETRIIALLDEKDIMLGAIGHDLKTPLTALRVRIEGVEDADERARMAGTIDDIAQSLDDILTLARVGRPDDAPEMVELSALLACVVEEYEDMGKPVTLEECPRIVLPLRVTWVRRALRNLIDNALLYGGAAHVSLSREADNQDQRDTKGRGWALLQIEDNGPGIPEAKITAMMEPFTRGEPSRNSQTGGAGLGLALTRAIAEQHGGTLTLVNRPASGLGLIANLRLPL